MNTNISKSPQKSKENFSKVDERVEAFVSKARPYRSKYIEKVPDGSVYFDGTLGYKWQTVDKYLTDGKISKAINDNHTYGYFITYSPSLFCIDIDDHLGRGIGYLTNIYKHVSYYVGKPSMLCKTPRGLHAYYFLSFPLPELLLMERVQHILKDYRLPAEVRPTSSTGIRIPSEHVFLDPETLQPLDIGYVEAFNSAEVYHPIEIFDLWSMPTPDSLVESYKRDSDYKSVKTKSLDKVIRAESSYLKDGGIQTGSTNIALCELAPVYRSAGLTVDQAVERFSILLEPGYIGELRRERRLYQRMQSFYLHEPRTRFNTIEERRPSGIYVEALIKALQMMLTGPVDTAYQRSALTKKRETIRWAIYRSEIWKDTIDGWKLYPQMAGMLDYMYPYWINNTSRGLYPFSRNLLQQIHPNYERWLLPYFKETGYFKRAEYRYNADRHICYYYWIDGLAVLKRYDEWLKAKEVKEPTQAELIQAYKAEHPLLGQRAIAAHFGISQPMVSRYLKSLSDPK